MRLADAHERQQDRTAELRRTVALEILTTSQLATLMQTSKRTIQRLVAEGQLRAYRLRAHGGYRFILDEVREDLLVDPAQLGVYHLGLKRIRELSDETIEK